jgi:aminoglycoside 6'-N-acetyltransferase
MGPIHTDRFVLRPLRMTDASALAHYRSDPETASLQSWTVPYPLERAESMIAGSLEVDGPVDGKWYSLGITDPAAPDPDELLGDVDIQLGWDSRSAELGYTLAPGARGRGAATEAAAAVVDYCFAKLGVQRFHAAIHPENFASAMVLERLGFIYEGTHRQAYWVGDECADDIIYGLLPADREAWLRDRA